MKRAIPIVVVLMMTAEATGAWAQAASPRVPSVEVTINPGGVTIVAEGSDTGEPSFANYEAGAAVALNLGARFSLEGEVSGAFGVQQNLQFATIERELTTPNMLHYAGNVAANLTTGRSLVPFVTAGVGGLTVFDRADITQRKSTFLATNIGAGVKWRTGRWGLRADYRFMRIEGRETEFAPNERPRPDFFGKETRYAHRLFGGIILTIH